MVSSKSTRSPAIKCLHFEGIAIIGTLKWLVPGMIYLLVWLFLGVGAALAQETACNTTSQFNDPKFQPILDRLKGAVSMSGKFVCSAAFVTFKGRSSATKGLVLTAGHCSDRGSIQIPLRDKTISAPDAGEVLYRLNDKRQLTLETGNRAVPRTCAETDEIVYGTLTGADLLLLRLTETYDQIEARTGVKAFTIAEDAVIPNGTPVRSPSSLATRVSALELSLIHISEPTRPY